MIEQKSHETAQMTFVVGRRRIELSQTTARLFSRIRRIIIRRHVI